MYRVLLVAMMVIAVTGALIGFSDSPDDAGLIGGLTVGVTLDLVIGLAWSIVLAIIRVAAGTEVRAHRHHAG
jgi:uncharacterized membrane protein